MSFFSGIFGISKAKPAAPAVAQPKAPSQGVIQGRTVSTEASKPAAAKAAALNIHPIPMSTPLVATRPLSVNLSPKQRFELHFKEFLNTRFIDPMRFAGFAEALENSRESSKMESMDDFNRQIINITHRNAPITYIDPVGVTGNKDVIQCKEQCKKYWNFVEQIEKNPELFDAREYDTWTLKLLLNLNGLNDQKSMIAKELISRHQNPSPNREQLYISEGLLAKMMEHGKPTKEEARKLIHYLSPLSAIRMSEASIKLQAAFLGPKGLFTLQEFSQEFSAAFKANGPFLFHLDSGNGLDLYDDHSYGGNGDYHALKLALFIYRDAELVKAFSEKKEEWFKGHNLFAKEVEQYIKNYQAADQFMDVVSNSVSDKAAADKVVHVNARKNVPALSGFDTLINLSNLDRNELAVIKDAFKDKKDLLLRSIDLKSLVKLHDLFDKEAMKERMKYLFGHTLESEIVGVLTSTDGWTLHSLAKEAGFQDKLQKICKRFKETQKFLPSWERIET